MALDQSHDFLTANNSLLEHLQDDEVVYGVNYNRIVDSLTGAYIGYTYVAHNDTWVNTENVDSTHPGRLNYVIPKNAVQVLDAVLSVKLLTYRTYNTFSASATGTESQGHSHSHNHGSHAHTIPIDTGLANSANLGYNGSGVNIATLPANAGGTAPVNSTTPSTDSTGESQTHTHSISGSSFLGISEGTSAAGVTLSFDGTDQTVALGGPFNSDVVELDVLQFLPQTQGLWHVINLGSTQLGQIQSHLRLTVLVSSPK